MPGGKYYGATQVNSSKGERWFCSEAEARAAGWRRRDFNPRAGLRLRRSKLVFPTPLPQLCPLKIPYKALENHR